MNLRELLAQKKALLEKRDALNIKVQEAKSIEELTGFENEIKTIELDLAKINASISTIKNNKASEDAEEVVTETKENARVQDTKEYHAKFFKAVRTGNFSEVKAATLTSDNRAVIPTTTFNKIITKLEQVSPLFASVYKTFVKGDLVVPIDNSDNPANGWGIAEGETIPTSAFKTSMITFHNFPLKRLVKVSLELINESIEVLENFVINKLVNSMKVDLERSILTGTGSNQPLGLLVDPKLTNKVNVLFKLDTTGYDDIVDVDSALPSLYEANAGWIMHKTTRNHLAKIKDNEGRPIFNRQDNTIFGYPVVLSDHAPKWQSIQVGKPITILGNYKDYYQFNVSSNATLATSEHSNFDEGLITFRGWFSGDGKALISDAFVVVIKAEEAEEPEEVEA